MKRNLKTVVFAVVLLVTLFTSCLSLASGRVVFLGNASPETAFVREIAPEFEAQTGIRVIVEDTPWPQLFEKLTLELVAGTGEYSIMTVPSEWLLQLQPFLASLDEDLVGIDDDFIPSLIDAYVIDNHFYGVPHYFNVLLTYYRTDLYEEAGVGIPTTWEEYIEVLQTINNKVGDKILAPGVTPLSRGTHNFVEFMQYLWSFGGSFLDENGRANLQSEEAYKALKFMYDTYHTWKVTPQSSFELSYIESGELFSQGKVATSFEWPRRISLNRDPRTSRVVDNWGVYPRPGVPWLGTWGLSVPANCSDKESAYKFISWLTEKENMKRLTLRGPITSRSSVLADPEVLAKTPELEVALASAEKGKNPPQLKGYEEIAQLMALEINEAIAGNKTIERALEDANTKINRILN